MSTVTPASTPVKSRQRMTYAPRSPTARSKLTNGTRGMVLPGIDQRSAIARRYRDVMCAIVSDQGGEDRLTEAKLQLIRRFSALVVKAEQMEAGLVEGQPFDANAHAHISSTLVRLATRIGVKRIAKDIVPDLRTYLDEQRAEGDE